MEMFTADIAGNVAICALSDGDYHFGLGALVNSLYRNGFRGVNWNGSRGSPPPWASPRTEGPGYQEYSVAENCVIRFINVGGTRAMPECKPVFLLDVWEQYDPNAEAVVYFDVDIVIDHPWHFFEEWVENGVALCMDTSDPYIPAVHQRKLSWKKLATEAGFSWMPRSGYYNAGFVGVGKEHKAFLGIWARLIDIVSQLQGYQDHVDVRWRSRPSHRSKRQEQDDLAARRAWPRYHPFFYMDQDTLNAALCVTGVPLAVVGPGAMGFVELGNHVMLHQVYRPKPWSRRFGIRSMLRGMPPTRSDVAYWQYADQPISVFSKYEILRRQRRIKWATRAGMVIRSLYRDNFG